MNTVRESKRFEIIDLVYMAFGAVLIAICSWISIPTTVPFTMQTFAVFFVLSALGGKRGTLSILVYVLLGAIGLPVFAQFTSGVGILLGSTGGYIVGFLLMGLTYWLMIRFLGKKNLDGDSGHDSGYGGTLLLWNGLVYAGLYASEWKYRDCYRSCMVRNTIYHSGSD